MPRSLGVMVALLFVGASVANAATIRPTRFDDPSPPGRCKADDCSLREAISKARADHGKDRVLLRAGTYEISIPETAADDNAGGDFDLKGSIKISGKGTASTTVSGAGVSGVFSLQGDAPKTIEGLRIFGGSAPSGAGVFVGPAGGDVVESKQRLRNLLIEGNVASENGGGVYTSSQRVAISKVTIQGNLAASGGGGVYAGSAPTLGFPSPPLAIAGSTLSGNAAGLGGGLYLDGANPPGSDRDPRASMVNATVANNTATVSGGGIAAILGADFTGEHVTVAYNGADSDSTGGGSGGGIYQSTDASFSIEESLVKENAVGTSGAGPQCAGEFRFIGVITPQGGTSCSFTGGSTIGPESDPRIGVLADNGGPTKTIAIAADSFANGFSDFCPAKDQRGVARPATDCDAGAFERP